MKRKYKNSGQVKKRARVNNLVKWDGPLGPWVVEQTYKASKLAFSDKKRNRKFGPSPRSPYAGVATGLLKTPRTEFLKSRQK